MSEDAERTRRVEKPWGHEVIWAHTDRYVGKLLSIRAGQRLSLQYHERKDESIYVVRGRMALHLADEHGALRVHELGPGEHRRIPRAGPIASRPSTTWR
jgi:mannose-6-phosphate isomerase